METITISVAEYDKMVEASDLLSALRDAGVDNWEGYYEACRALHADEWTEDEDDNPTIVSVKYRNV